jgi:hypothetical protein
MDFIAPQCAPRDKSLLRFPDGSNNLRVGSPSPSASNNFSELIELNYQADSVQVNVAGGFYSSTQEIVISNSIATNIIRYTTNSKEPDVSSSAFSGEPIVFQDITDRGLRFADESDLYVPRSRISKANILRAQVFSEGCPASEEFSASYFISQNNVFHYNVPLVSIITDKDNLFDEEEGIYIYGNHGNYLQKGKKWERQAHFQYFTKNKKLVVDQHIGIRIHGRGSRKEPQKSLRLYAREEYGAETFNYAFFDQKHINEFTHLLLSVEKSFSPVIFKDELTHSLVQELNLDYQAWQTCVVFINGEYWGIQHLREHQNANYVSNNHPETVPDIDVITHELYKGVAATTGDIIAYNELIELLEDESLSDNEKYEIILAQVDLDHMLDYFASQIYFANFDFPDNNYRMWRSKSEDGKWRWFFYDCEACMYFPDNNNLTEYISFDELPDSSPEWSTIVFKEMLKIPQIRQQFKSRIYALLHTTFNARNVLSKIEEFETTIAPLMGEHIYRWNQPENYFLWTENLETLKQFAIQRPVYLQEHVSETLGDAMDVYPNPSKGEFSILIHDPTDKVEVEISQMNGVLIYSNQFYNSDKIDLSLDLTPGIYVVNTKSNFTVQSEKIIIKP